jgi:hypothetical protein
MDLRASGRSIVAAGALAAGLLMSGPAPADAHVVEVTTSLPIEHLQDKAELKQALRAEVDRVLAGTIAFKPTVVTLTDARQIGDRLMVRLLIADEDGERLIQEIERAAASGAGRPELGAPTGGVRPDRL